MTTNELSMLLSGMAIGFSTSTSAIVVAVLVYQIFYKK